MYYMKKGSTLFLRLAVAVMGLIVLVLSIFVVPAIIEGWTLEFPAIATYTKYLIAIGAYGTIVPFFIALWQAFKILGYIDKNTAFGEQSVTALKRIKQCAIVIGIIYVASGMPLSFLLAEADDAPGVIIVGSVLACAPFVIAVFAAVLQRLLRNAINIKSENDLTV